jgi:glutamyl-tRNA reductase
MSVLAVGLSHRSAPLPLLERAALAAADTPLTERLLAAEHVLDAVVLATCNRVEVYAQVSRFHGGVEDIVSVLAESSELDLEALMSHLYVHYDSAAAAHLFTVAAGLDSMAVGESQILGQVRRTWQRTQGGGRPVRALDELFQRALRAGRRAQAETGLDRASNTLVEHALDRAIGMLGTQRPRTVVLGAGAMAAVVVASLTRRGVDDLTVVNRSQAAARRLAETTGGRTAPWEGVTEAVAEAQLVVACTGAVGHVVDGRELAAARVVPRRPGVPDRAVMVDLALPRDVDPLVAQVAGVTVLDLEDLGAELADLGVRDEVRAARAVIAEEVTAWRAEQSAVGVTPTVVALREQGLAILDAELDRLERRLPDLPEAARAEIRQAVRRVVEKVLHTPTVRVKELADGPGGSFYAEALRALFDLDPARVANGGPVPAGGQLLVPMDPVTAL